MATTRQPRVIVLRFDSAQFLVHIGNTEEERAQSQEVSLSMALQFRELPRACLTDRLEDTVCYDALVRAAALFCARKPYRLLEAMGHELFAHIRQTLAPSIDLWLMLTKMAPRALAIRGGVSFAIGDFAPPAPTPTQDTVGAERDQSS